MSSRAIPTTPRMPAPRRAWRVGASGVATVLALIALAAAHVEQSRGGHRHVYAHGGGSEHHHHNHLAPHDHGSHSHAPTGHGPHSHGSHRHGSHRHGQHSHGPHNHGSDRHGHHARPVSAPSSPHTHPHGPAPDSDLPAEDPAIPWGSTYAVSLLTLSSEAGNSTIDLALPRAFQKAVLLPPRLPADVGHHRPAQPRGPPYA